jgi:hypothetical protein
MSAAFGMVAVAAKPVLGVGEVAGFEPLPFVAIGGLDEERAQAGGEGEVDEPGEVGQRAGLEADGGGLLGRGRMLPEAATEERLSARPQEPRKHRKRVGLSPVGVVRADADDDVGRFVLARRGCVERWARYRRSRWAAWQPLRLSPGS